MAEFYQASPVEGADFTGYSKGFKGDTSVGDAFSAAGDVLGMAVQATDQYYQGTVKEEARAETSKLMDDYGNDAAVDAVGGIESTATPKEIQQGADRLALLNQAQKNGTLKQSSFWAQAELISRQLKMRYPGYWEHIDSAMSSQLGRKPAQALQAELQSEREAAASASDRERSSALKAARTAGLTDVLIAEQQGKGLSTAEINVRVANRNNIEWTQQKVQRDLALKKSRGEAAEEDFTRAARLEGSNILTTMTRNATAPFFQNMKEFDEAMDTLQRQRASGKGVDPELQASVSGLVDQLKENISNAKAQLIVRYSGDVPADKLTQQLSFMDDWADTYTKLLSEGDTEVARSNTALLQATKDSDAFQFLTSNDAFRKAAAVVRAIGPEYRTNWEARNAGSRALAVEDRALEEAMSNDFLLGNRTVSNAVRELQGQNVKDPRAFNTLIKKVSRDAVADDLPQEQVENANIALYGEKNSRFLLEDVPNSQRVDLLASVAAPANLKNARKLYEAGKLSPTVYEQMFGRIRQWSSQLLRDQAADINEISTARKSRGIEFDESTGLIKDYPLGSYEPEADTLVGRGIVGWNENYLAKRSSESIQKANRVLKIVKQTAELNGDNPSAVVKQLMAEAGIVIFDKEEVENPKAKQDSAVEAGVKTIEDFSAKIYEGLEELGKSGAVGIDGQSIGALKDQLDSLLGKNDTSEIVIIPEGTEDNPIILDEGADMTHPNTVNEEPEFLNTGKGPQRGT